MANPWGPRGPYGPGSPFYGPGPTGGHTLVSEGGMSSAEYAQAVQLAQAHAAAPAMPLSRVAGQTTDGRMHSAPYTGNAAASAYTVGYDARSGARRYAPVGGLGSTAGHERGGQLVPGSMLGHAVMLPEDAAKLDRASKPIMGAMYTASADAVQNAQAQSRMSSRLLTALGEHAPPEVIMQAGGPLVTITQDVVSNVIAAGALTRGAQSKFNYNMVNIDPRRPVAMATQPVTTPLDANIPYSLLEYGVPPADCGQAASQAAVHPLAMQSLGIRAAHGNMGSTTGSSYRGTYDNKYGGH